MQHKGKTKRDFLMLLIDSCDRKTTNYANSTIMAHILCKEAKKATRFRVATPLPELGSKNVL